MTSADIRRARRAFLWVGVLVPVAITVLGTLVIAVWLPQLPDPAAVHWSGGGGPDGFGPGWTYLLLGSAVPLGLIALFSVIALFAHRLPPRTAGGPEWSATARLVGAANLGAAVMLSFTTLVSVGVQRGLADAADAPDITGWVFAGFGLMAASGVAGWFLQPSVAAPAGSGRDAAPLPLAPSERAVWTATATTARGGRIVIAAALFLTIASAVVMLAVDAAGWQVMAIVALVLVVLSLTMLTFRVRVAADGLSVRSAAGWPRFHVPLEEITGVRVVPVNPFAEFGGWGLRYGLDGRFGVVLRTGQAIEVGRRRRGDFVVTVDDAETGAALLAALSGRGRGADAADTGGPAASARGGEDRA